MNSIQKTLRSPLNQLSALAVVVDDGGGSNFSSKRAHASINFDYSEKLSIIMNKWNKWGMPLCVLDGGAQLSAPFP